MFQGFNSATIQYFEAIRMNNSKAMHHEKEALYLEGVREPLIELYYEMAHYFERMDPELISNQRRCISSAYNDARFCTDEPVKEYMYLRFKIDKKDKKNAVGFFFDCSLEDYRYGLHIYNMDSKGMECVRNEILNNKYSSEVLIRNFHTMDVLQLHGEQYKTNRFPEESEQLQNWLNRKSLSFYHEEPINEAFFSRDLLDEMLSAVQCSGEVYFMLKDALSNSTKK